MEEKSFKETIKFSGTDPEPTFAVHSRDVEIISATGTGTNGISRIKANNIVDYSWEERFYTGQMLAVHRSGKYVAYGIKGRTKSQGTIRIVNRLSSNRALMKDAEGLIEDLSFAQTFDVILLACIDSTGTLLVYHITENPAEISTKLILHVMPGDSLKKSIPYRVFWCSYIPEDDDDDEEDDVSKLLAITRYNKVELWNIGAISPNLEPTEGPIKSGDVKNGFLVIEAHDDLITEAVFSPDGTAIATASLDGTCKFYQVYMPPGEAESRCLHQWSPHHGRPVTTLFFLDDLRKFNPDVPFWKYAVTGTENNSELSLWSCETWQRLQLIKFKHTETLEKKFKIGIDYSASVIVINDMPNKILYILELNKGEIQNTIPYIAAVTELRLHYAILSFGIVDASIGPHPPTMSPALEKSPSRLNGSESEEELGVMMRMYIVQPKSLQSCNIAYPTKRSVLPIPSPALKEDYPNGDCAEFDNEENTTSEEDPKPDSTLNNDDDASPSSQEEVVDCVPLTPPPPSLSLMTPDAFSSSCNVVTMSMTEASVDETTGQMVDNTSSPVQPVETSMDSYSTLPPSDSVSPDLPSQSGAETSQIKSGGSSPSREVEEILGMKNVTMFPDAPDVPDQVSSPPQPINLPQPQLQQQQPPQLQQSYSQTRIVTCEDKSVGPVISVAEVQDLKDEIKTLCQLLEKQCHRIQELENEVKSLKNRDSREETNMELLGKILIEKMSEHQEKTEKLHSMTIERMNSHQEETVSHICQLVDNSVCTRIPPMIQSQLVNLINPTIKDLKDMIHKELTIKLTATDVLLKENIAKMGKSKVLIDALSSGVAIVGKESVNHLCKEALSLTVPKIEKICSTLMSDMSDTFSNGTAQYVSEVEAQLKRLTEHWHVEVNNMHASFLQKANTQTMQIIEKAFGELEDRLFKKLSKTVVKAVNSGVTSRVMTPAVGSSSQAEIMDLVHKGQLSDAFQQALSAAELPLVLSLCEKVPIGQIFTSRGSVLPQPVLLSLIQQLSSDLTTYSETKHRYLEESIMNLDSKNAVTREHMPKVLSSLNKQLIQFMATNPLSPYLKKVKMLQMATSSLIN